MTQKNAVYQMFDAIITDPQNTRVDSDFIKNLTTAQANDLLTYDNPDLPQRTFLMAMACMEEDKWEYVEGGPTGAPDTALLLLKIFRKAEPEIIKQALFSEPFNDQKSPISKGINNAVFIGQIRFIPNEKIRKEILFTPIKGLNNKTIMDYLLENPRTEPPSIQSLAYPMILSFPDKIREKILQKPFQGFTVFRQLIMGDEGSFKCLIDSLSAKSLKTLILQDKKLSEQTEKDAPFMLRMVGRGFGLSGHNVNAPVWPPFQTLFNKIAQDKDFIKTVMQEKFDGMPVIQQIKTWSPNAYQMIINTYENDPVFSEKLKALCCDNGSQESNCRGASVKVEKNQTPAKEDNATTAKPVAKQKGAKRQPSKKGKTIE